MQRETAAIYAFVRRGWALNANKLSK